MPPSPSPFPGIALRLKSPPRSMAVSRIQPQLRDVELIRAERGVVVTLESIRLWCTKFGSDLARRLKRRWPRPGDTWHLDEVSSASVVFCIVCGAPWTSIALCSTFYCRSGGMAIQAAAAQAEIQAEMPHHRWSPQLWHRSSSGLSRCPPSGQQYLNNRAENSHRPTRRRERQIQQFKSPEQAQRFLSAYATVYGHFRPRRHRMTAAGCRLAWAKAFRVWRQEICVTRQHETLR